MKTILRSPNLWISVVIMSILFQSTLDRCSAQGTSEAIRIDGCKNSRNVETLLYRSFIDTYGKKIASEIDYEQLLFSPDGKFLAVSISQVTCGDPEQIWVVDLKNDRVRLATELVVDGKVGIRILSDHWISSDTLSIEIERIDWLDQNNNVSLKVRATIDTSIISPLGKQRDSGYPSYYELSTSPTGRFRIISGPDSTVVLDVAHQTIIRRLNTLPWMDIQWSADEHHFLFVKNHGHGFLSLGIGTTVQKVQLSRIADGSWELEGACFSPTGTAVAYPGARDVIIYGISEKKAVEVIDTGSYPNLVAWGAGDEIAVSCGSCKQDQDTTRILNHGGLSSPHGLYLIDLR